MYERGEKIKVSKVDDSLNMGIHFIEAIQVHCMATLKDSNVFF
jgi:hypothetical protein